MIRTPDRRVIGLVVVVALVAAGLTGTALIRHFSARGGAADSAAGTEGSVTGQFAAADEPAERIVNGGFDKGTGPWWWTKNTRAKVTDGRLCTSVPGRTRNPWSTIVAQNDIKLRKGESYTFAFRASASAPVKVKANVQLADAPYTPETQQSVTLGDMKEFRSTFTSKTDTSHGSVQFQVGGAGAGWDFCLNDVSLLGSGPRAAYVPDTGPRVRVNQVGYLPHGPKNATIVSNTTRPLVWQLRTAAGRVAARGSSTPHGFDAASGQNVHTVDFSRYQQAGKGYTLTADGEKSHPFDISARLYEQLRTDALQFFYLQRSGTPIDGSLVGAKYARPAGHLGVAPNQGDTDVPCQEGVCDYKRDVRGGWYDAGDHGKYVVNGGIATYQLLSAWERAVTATTGQTRPLADGSLRVPERGNGVPDVLDEARWELEFLLRMQVPAGQKLAGMVHHKVHDQNWTGLPMAPEADPQRRELHPPSTAATLNLAATAAQCARVFKVYDRAFASRCQAAATSAWRAALAHPDVYASDTDSTGGGAYGDTHLDDEFYWAAVELYLTTGRKAYLDRAIASPTHTANVFGAGGFGWQTVGALGRLDLATTTRRLPAEQRRQVRASVLTAADRHLRTLRAQGYGLPLADNTEFYGWGSNSNILNNLVVLGTAYDLTGRTAYRDGALQGIDYLLGRNALDQSYVTGYGERNPQNQHSRIFAHQLDPKSPNPPAGSLAGGANAGLQDPYAQELLAGCRPQFCYVDNIESYSTNEVAINWNSALAWVASFAADQNEPKD